jgi:hypothetical protein
MYLENGRDIVRGILVLVFARDYPDSFGHSD